MSVYWDAHSPEARAGPALFSDRAALGIRLGAITTQHLPRVEGSANGDTQPESADVEGDF